MRVIVRKIKRRGRTEWVVDARVQGKRRRSFFQSKVQADTEAEALRLHIAQAGESWVGLPSHERASAMLVLREIQEAGLSIRNVWDEYRRLAPKPMPRKTLSAAIEECLASKTTAARRPSYVKGLRAYLRQFSCGRESVLVSDITSNHLLSWFAGRKFAPATTAAIITRFSTFFTWCMKRGYIRDNPSIALERPNVEAKPPMILSVRQACRLVATCIRSTPDLLAWLVLGLFAGLRPEEADRVDWEAWDHERSILRVDAAASKVRQRRIVNLEPNANEWLSIAHDLGNRLPMPKVTRRRHQRALREAMGWEAWPSDVLRHTAASYLLALHQDVGKVARTLGNSPGILLRHYHELVARHVALRFWMIKPKARHRALTCGVLDHP